ncbi:MAG TPA: hypothetical protein VGG19_08960 [Tepidisphaeraceae bacterium]|jgi:hypothetical protein
MSQTPTMPKGAKGAHKREPDRHEFEGLCLVNGVEMYRIAAYDSLAQFMMTLTSCADHWMYLSSFGGLCAGRGDAEHALFSYETEDRLHHLHGITGPITLIAAEASDGKKILWEPFNPRLVSSHIRRNIYKTVLSDRVLFEEIHHELDLTFRYQWACSPRFGFVRTATLLNNRPARSIRIEILDGLLNLQPAGVPLVLQQTASCLVDAYKRCEWDESSQLAIYSLSSLISDRPEPGECLKATTVFSRGLKDARVLFAQENVAHFRGGSALPTEHFRAGTRAAFLLHSSQHLAGGMQLQWDIAADVDQDHAAIASRRQFLVQEKESRSHIAADLEIARRELAKMTNAADAQQTSADVLACAHHAANVLFNNLRGGVPADGYNIHAADFAQFLKQRNKLAALRCQDFLADLPADLTIQHLLEKSDTDGDPDLRRLAREYLPLILSRRHGDPSRPWNRFSIRWQNADGTPAIHYEGNWRDIFQNWEALAASYPDYLQSFITKFVSASTLDGFNPYRLSDDGIDWERHEPADPWSNIGYWGDHQIIYLLKFLEAASAHDPSLLSHLLTQSIFTYANVPYRIRSYADLINDPRQSIIFDHDLDRRIGQRVSEMGADGKLICDSAGNLCRANLLEKLLVPMLAKLGNLVLAGGIWMNTQRPEWNDANNALAGFGLSMVTLCYLRRYVQFLIELLKPLAEKNLSISEAVLDWLNETGAILLRHSDLLRMPAIDDIARRRLLDDLGHAFDLYRQRVYTHGPGAKTSTPISEILPTLRLTLSYLDYSIDASRQPDGLYHSYNVLNLQNSGAHIEHLQLMLEGQVAVLSSGKIESDQAIEILESLFASPLYRKDQDSFLLYPFSQARPFLSRNRLAREQIMRIPLLAAMIEGHDHSIITRDAGGDFHFAAQLHNSGQLNLALNALENTVVHSDQGSSLRGAPQFSAFVSSSRNAILDLYEKTFNHHHFTGRSGAMHAYEGIGSIYWHMIGKLLLATQECFWRSEAGPQQHRLGELYYRIRDGMGFNKSALSYGAFPIDPHSHTPASSGARQPGMTGQVKEEILRRFGELGVRIENGCVHFNPILLRRREFLLAPAMFGELHLDIASLAFTYCGTTILYRLSENPLQVRVIGVDSGTNQTDKLTAARCRSLFRRDRTIQRIEVSIPARMIQFD